MVAFLRHYIFPCLFGSLILVTYLFSCILKESNYTVILDGKIVNFTGVEDFIPPFVNIISDYFVASNHKMMTCGIRKSMSQLAINTVCLLKDEQQFINGNHSMNETWHSARSCVYDNPEFRIPSDALLNDSETVRFAFIRDPIERFVSLYLDKCLRENECYECGDDMRCIVKEIYNGLKKLQNYRKCQPVPTYIDIHAAPLSWNCNFDKDLAKWNLLMMGADAEERKSSILQLANIMKRQGVTDEVVDKFQKETIAGETSHSTHKSSRRLEAERQVREDPVVRDYLHKIYFFDYLVFPFNRDPLDIKYQTDFWKISELCNLTL